MKSTYLFFQTTLSLAACGSGDPPTEITLARAAYQKGADLLRAGNHAAALSEFRESASLYEACADLSDPGEFAAALNNLGATLSQLGEHVRAAPVLRRSLFLAPKSHPRRADIAGNLAIVYLAIGDIAAAAPLAEQALSEAESTRSVYQPYALAIRGQIRLANRQFEAGLRDAEAALRFEMPGSLTANVQHLRAWLLFSLRRSDEGLEALNQAIRIDPRPAFLRDYAKMMHSKRKNPKPKARRDFIPVPPELTGK